MKIIILLALVATALAEENVNRPFSILSSLTQLSLASEGYTHDQLLKAIGMPNDNVTKSVYSSITNELKSVKEVKIINKIYIQEGAELSDDFAALSKDLFNTETEYIDFSKNEEASQHINAWVQNNTNNLVTNLTRPFMLSSMTASVLVNTFLYKASWKHKFDKNNTTLHDFYFDHKYNRTLPTMYNRNVYNYAENAELDAQLIELPYEGDQASLFLAVPKKIEGITELKAKLQSLETQEKAFSNLSPKEIELYIPTFGKKSDINTSFKLREMVGKKDLFNASAQISHLLKGNDHLYINDATQIGTIFIDDVGTSAAEANVYKANWKAPKIATATVTETPIQLDINRPFYYLLKHNDLVITTGSCFSL